MAKLFDAVVFDQIVDGPATVYSDPSFNHVLSRADKLVITAVAMETTGVDPVVSISVEGSPNHTHWASLDGPAPFDRVTLTSNVALATRTFAGDQVAHTRLKIVVTTAAKARLQVHVTGRTV